MQKVANPIPIFVDARGALLDGGKIYLGVADGDPQTDPIVAYWDSDLTVIAAQPIRTVGGRIVNGATPAQIFIAEDDYSMRITDSDDALVDYSPKYHPEDIAYQPVSSDLSAIAALQTTPYGRGLLTLANQAALLSALGTLPYLSSNGGNVGSNIFVLSGGYQLGTDGDKYTALDQNGNLILNGLPGLLIRINRTRKSFDFLVDNVESCYIDATGLHNG